MPASRSRSVAIALTTLLAPAVISGRNSPAAPSNVVMTDAGALRGSIAGDTIAFKGIPYAAPPVGPLRWVAPQRIAPWDGVRDATEFGPVCPQPGSLPGTDTKWFGSEDCLTLNVWVPRRRTASERLPVLFFIHGGGNSRGSGSASVATTIPVLGPNVQNGERLAENARAIVVTINYRLGILGWLAHAALSTSSATGTSGNYGLQDQTAALRWLQRNITAFGGDARRVLAFGQSAGARDLCGLVASPTTKGLFTRAAFLSNSCENFPTLAAASRIGDEFARSVACGVTADVAACLRQLPLETLLLTSVRQAPKLQGFQLGPIVDGLVLTGQPLVVIRSGAHQRLPALVSSAANEVAFSLFPAYWPGAIETTADYDRAIETLAGPQLVEDIKRLYPVEAYATPRAALTTLLSDVELICPARRTARALAGTAPVWRAVWTHTASSGPARAFGPAHVTDLPYWFDTIREMPGFQPTQSEVSLAQQMTRYLGSLAAKGRPDVAGAGGWPRYIDRADADLRLDDSIVPGSAFRGRYCDFWDTRLPPPG
jgi:para-nitrobenzyl esterase